jgi:hypothetical protein
MDYGYGRFDDTTHNLDCIVRKPPLGGSCLPQYKTRGVVVPADPLADLEQRLLSPESSPAAVLYPGTDKQSKRFNKIPARHGRDDDDKR